MITVYGIEQAEEWDRIVRSFEDYDIYWLSGYVRAFQIHGDGMPVLLLYEGKGTRAMNVVMKRDIAEDTRFSGKIEGKRYFDISTPYGYGGWLMEGACGEGLFAEHEKWCKGQGIVSEFVRFHPMVGNHEMCRGLYEVARCGHVVHMDISTPEIIWDNMSSKNRNVIRKAMKSGVKIYHGQFPEIYEEFRIVYNEAMGRNHAGKFYYFDDAFYQSILEDLPQNAQVFFAKKDGIVVAASIMLSANGRMNYHLSGGLDAYRKFAPTNLLLYQAALWGCANGCRTLYLGGGVGSGEDNLFKFKKSFSKGEPGDFHIGKRVVDKEIYDHLCELRGIASHGMDVGEIKFFPEYREGDSSNG